MAIGVYTTKDQPGAGAGDSGVHVQEYKEINVGDTLETTVMVEQVVMDSAGAVVYDAREHFAGTLTPQGDGGEDDGE